MAGVIEDISQTIFIEPCLDRKDNVYLNTWYDKLYR